jgi:hypothetical protein
VDNFRIARHPETELKPLPFKMPAYQGQTADCQDQADSKWGEGNETVAGNYVSRVDEHHWQNERQQRQQRCPQRPPFAPTQWKDSD